MSEDPLVNVILPGMLGAVLGKPKLRVRATTVGGALEAAYAEIPALRHHLCEASGAFRTHVLCLHNGVSTRRESSLEDPVEDGDEVRIVQAISGG